MGLGRGTAERKNRRFRNLTLHSKIAITATLILIFGGGILIFLFEYGNPLTIGNMYLFDKLQVSLFQSVTTRTAGFATVAQQDLTNASSILCLLLMFGSKRTLTPWLVSVFSLALPLIILVINVFPA